MRRLGVLAMPAGAPRGSKRNLRAVFVEEAPRRDIALPPPQLLNSNSVAMTTRRVPAVPFAKRENTSRPTQSPSAAPPGLGAVEKARRARANRTQMRRARAAAQDDGSAVLRHASVSPATQQFSTLRFCSLSAVGVSSPRISVSVLRNMFGIMPTGAFPRHWVGTHSTDGCTCAAPPSLSRATC